MPSSTAACRYCGADPEAATSCSRTTYQLGARESLYMRVPFGAENPRRHSGDHCPECGTPAKGVHHSDCPAEECPLCRTPFGGCRCAKP